MSANNVSHERATALMQSGSLKAPAGKPVDALLITAMPNVRYLSGFTGSSGLLLVTGAGATLFTDPRYSIQARQQTPFPVRVGKGPLLPLVIESLKRRKLKRLGVERNRISFEAWDTLRAALPAGFEIVPVSEAVETLRMVKSADEIGLIRESVETNSRALRRALRSFRAGMREMELAAEIDYQARRAGAEAPAFDTIVASGERSALPHARPSDTKIRDKGLLLIDMGAFQSGYASDMTRTMYVGKASKRVKVMYKAVLEAQLAALNAVRPGATAELVDRAAREVLETAGFGENFVHSTGHGLGLEIHEPPRLGKKSQTMLAEGMAITVEPGVYVEGFGGIRIEDTVVVTSSGCEILTPTSKEFVEL